MDRRESLKSIVLGSVAGGLALTGCQPELGKEEQAAIESIASDYGRTEKEKAHDAKMYAQQFFTDHEMDTLKVLCALILPANGEFGSATDAGSTEFIEFMAKDYPPFQLKLRGGLMELNHESNKLYGKVFKDLTEDQQHTLLTPISFPDLEVPSNERPAPVQFFSLMRNLTLTGYYTSEMGIKDLGYKGNSPNVWDGVPEEVLAKHGVAYDPEWIAKCIDQSKRNIQAEWDEEGNLLT